MNQPQLIPSSSSQISRADGQEHKQGSNVTNRNVHKHQRSTDEGVVSWRKTSGSPASDGLQVQGPCTTNISLNPLAYIDGYQSQLHFIGQLGIYVLKSY